jgi:glycosyltransferase 2 family protein
MNRKWISLGIGCAVSLGCLGWVLSREDLGGVAAKIGQFGVAGLVAFAGLHGLAQLLRGVRLWLLAGPECGLTLGGAWRAVFVGYAANNLVPLRVGELVKAMVLSRRSSLAMPQTLGLVAVERMMDGLVLVGLLLAGLAALPTASAEMAGVRKAATVMGVVFGVALLGLVGVVALRTRLAAWLQGKRPVAVSAALVRLLGVLARLSDPGLVLKLVAVGLGIWALEVSVFWLGARWIGLEVGWAGALLCQGVAALGVAVPSAPGNVGVFEAAVVVAIGVLGGGQQAGLALGVAVHAAHWLLDTTIGLLLLPGLGLKLGGAPAKEAGSS